MQHRHFRRCRGQYTKQISINSKVIMKAITSIPPAAPRLPRFASLLVLSAALGLSVPPASAQNLLLNGDFEINGGLFSGVPNNWNLIVNSFGAYNGSFNSLAPESGSWFIHVGDSGGPGGEYQDIATVAGQQYSLSFWGAPWSPLTERGIVQVGTPGSDPLSLSLNNSAEYVNSSFIVSGVGGASAWTPFTFDFTAATSITRVSFQNSYYVSPADSAVNVDNVSVTMIPEPSAIGVGILGLLMLRPFVRRRSAV